MSWLDEILRLPLRMTTCERDIWLKQGPPGGWSVRQGGDLQERGDEAFYNVSFARWLTFLKSEMSMDVVCGMTEMAGRSESRGIIQTIFVCSHPGSLRNAHRYLPRLRKEFPREEDYGWGW